MRLYVTSDIHLEFGDLDLQNSHDVDVLILSGDILVAQDIGRPDAGSIMEGARSLRIRDFFRRCSERFPHTVLIMGNHEHYYGDFVRTQDVIQVMLDQAGLDNIYLLEKQTQIIDDHMFIGGTLWTDFNGQDPLTMYAVTGMMNDFRGVKYGARAKFLPQDALEDHLAMLRYIHDTIDQRRAQGERSDRVIVVGHHAPSRLSMHAKYRHDHTLNGAFSSDLDQFILDHPEICLWTHGHTHEDFDYEIGSTRIVCNPRGYIGHEVRADSWQPKLIEL